ncbi:MAG: recombinase family protein [Candidatus Sulfotelmatobacter sp.]
MSGAKAKRPALDQMLAAAHRREFDILLVWAADRLARSVRHFLEVLDTLNHLGIEFVSFRENRDTGGPLGGAVVVCVGGGGAGAEFNYRAGPRRTEARTSRRSHAWAQADRDRSCGIAP